jgi:hypothetical protein
MIEFFIALVIAFVVLFHHKVASMILWQTPDKDSENVLGLSTKSIIALILTYIMANMISVTPMIIFDIRDSLYALFFTIILALLTVVFRRKLSLFYI